MKKSELKKIITHCLNRVHSSEGAIDNSIKEAMKAIDDFSLSLGYPSPQAKKTTSKIKDSESLTNKV